MTADRPLSRSVDYLGFIGAKLRDLQGYRTLASELIQNADDARATSLSFDITDKALIVDNDSVFSDCGHAEEEICLWKKERGYKCDFHRFRSVASGDKRWQQDTIGAFGIGFIAVYQITDYPELISAGRHWKIREDNPEEKRIMACGGCTTCQKGHLPRTRFILPWAYEKGSHLRSSLRVESVPPDGPQRFRQELESFLPEAILFLKHLKKLSILYNGQLVRTFEKIHLDGQMIVSEGAPENDRIWYLFQGDFTEESVNLKQKYKQIEDKRSSKVTLAVSDASLEKGLVYAYLPTTYNAGLPFHINADFYTTNDRKRIILENDYQSEWNRAALRAAAQTFGDAIKQLPQILGPEKFWALLKKVREVFLQNKCSGEPTLKAFWEYARESLAKERVIYTTQKQWVLPKEAYFLSQKEESKAIPVLEALGFKIVNEILRPYQSLLREIKIHKLDIRAIYEKFQELGFIQRIKPNELPPALAQKEYLEALWSEIALLLKHQPEFSERIKSLPLAPGDDGSLWPCKDIYQSDEETINLFKRLCPDIVFLSSEEAFKPLRHLCPPFTARVAVKLLQEMDSQFLEHLWAQRHLPIDQILQWFEKRRDIVLQDKNLKKSFKQIPMFPSGKNLRRLADLALPGNFKDPIGLADVVDLHAIGMRYDFLRDLGVQELDFLTYATKFLPEALKDDIPHEKRRAAVRLLAHHLGELKENPSARDILAQIPLIECSDGRSYPATECYFPNADVRKCLGDSTPYALLENPPSEPIEDLYRWLGVADKPRIDDLLKKIDEISSRHYSPESVKQIELIVGFLDQYYQTANEVTKQKLEKLKRIAWLPAEGKIDQWYKPDELYAVYQKYLFESQALFLGLSRAVQNEASNFLKFLGVQHVPPTELVVNHLLHCIERQKKPHKEIYNFLNSKTNDPNIKKLQGTKCLWSDGAYYRPDEVFWQQHNFGRYRKQLESNLRQINDFLEKIGVKEHPTWEDALKVLQEISEEFGSRNIPLDEEAHTVLWHCWIMLNEALENENENIVSQALKTLQTIKCVPNNQRILYQPSWIFIEDQHGLANKFNDFLKGNIVIPPLNTRKALTAAGVRLLREAVQVQIVECEQRVDDLELTEIIRTRRLLFQRIVASADKDIREKQLLRLDTLRCQSVALLKIRYRLQAFNREIISNPETISALYIEKDNLLLFTPQNREYPYLPLARELALALLADGDPGLLASAFKDVLAAKTFKEAQRTLDELYYAPLGEIPTQVTKNVEAINTLGEDRFIETIYPPESTQTHNTPADTLLDESIKSNPAENLNEEKHQAPPKTRKAYDFPLTEKYSKKKNSSRHRQSTRMVLRSYVIHSDESAALTTEDSPSISQEHRKRIDQAGIQRVLDFEKNAGRIPESMPHTHPGYDILSKDKEGNIVRYIEVKSLSGKWNGQYVTLSKTQFEKAQKLGDKFWLYVVEQAESENYRIYCIPNPAAYANHFMFDDGWRSIAEIEPTTSNSE
ncbi:hypothetical protein ARMA_1937 [Ardenticatena maritima]|uniref:Uncharacterized protein n=1 Tax=Ardenticatena maritima TaxID=872965 RepID=A0A0M9UD02_9CHLR|nr:DUF3883 domain-containing protein [Ardenticatena maritima]GAP63514.1 hypothetical protein ARMA_1937 [Ardenticatena maritima]